MNVLEAKDIPQVAMDAMNDIHQEELGIVNQVNAAIVANNSEKITTLCQQWLEHTQAHFDKENYMMERYDFPALHCHQREHADALQLLQQTIEQWNASNDQEKLTVYVRDTWPQWYVNHISTMDVVTSGFIKQSMLDEAS